MNRCPVCGYPDLERPPRDFTICPSCGTEFEYHDFGVTQSEVDRSRAELRNEWVARGMPWHSRVDPRPMDWNPLAQLADAELPFQWPEGGIAARPFTGVEMTEERGKMIAVDA